MKKILLINTKYREYGGEDSNFLEEAKFLSENYEIKCLEFENSNIGIFELFSFITKNNFNSNRALVKELNSFKPDYVYVHNTWFKASLGIFNILKKHKIPIILKIHNFRFDCTKSFLSSRHLGSEEFCKKCGFEGKNKIFNKYFKESYLKSIFVILYGKKYIKILINFNLKILALTNHQKIYLEKLGIDKKNITIHENPIVVKEDKNVMYNPKSNYVVYAGRISDQKGVRELIEAWVKSDCSSLSLKIIGEGDLLSLLKKEFSELNIEFMGQLPNKKVLNLIMKSRAVVTATKMFEGQPRLLCEASMHAVPSIFPSFGGMGEFYTNNYLFKFEQYNYNDLSKKFELLLNEDVLKTTSEEILSFIKVKLSKERLLTNFDNILEDINETQ
tara:strand:- start:53358 stop:54521 length:1164 start_codon:yes stop_codon:yes gene_type:complete